MERIAVGCSVVDITPPVGIPLSGFIARMGKPSTGIADPLHLRALALRSKEEVYFLLNYDLLLVGAILKEKIFAVLTEHLGSVFSPKCCIIAATHTHSGPSGMPLEGEPDAPEDYLNYVAFQSVKAVSEALVNAVPARLEQASLHVPGITYNRRQLLADGRVSISVDPDGEVVSCGPVDDRLTVLLWRSDADGAPIAGIAHYASHGVTMMTQQISADFPGEISRRMSSLLGAPCLYLQGAAGDLNPRVVAGERGPMLELCNTFMESLPDLTDHLKPVSLGAIKSISQEIELFYNFMEDRNVLESRIAGWDRIGKGETNSPDLKPAAQALADLMNLKPGEDLDPALGAVCAQAMASAGRRTLATMGNPWREKAYTMLITVWALGDIRFVFLCGEMFCKTGIKLREIDPKKMILPVTYVAPTIGYIPDKEAMKIGGYEVDFAWRFCGQPAPFAEDTEERIVGTTRYLLSALA